MNPKPDFAGTGRAIGELVEEKNTAYGSAFADSARFLELLYPSGVPLSAYTDVLLMVRIFDKMKRIATAKDAFGEDPFRDIAGYGVIGAAVRATTKEE